MGEEYNADCVVSALVKDFWKLPSFALEFRFKKAEYFLICLKIP